MTLVETLVVFSMFYQVHCICSLACNTFAFDSKRVAKKIQVNYCFDGTNGGRIDMSSHVEQHADFNIVQ